MGESFFRKGEKGEGKGRGDTPYYIIQGGLLGVIAFQEVEEVEEIWRTELGELKELEELKEGEELKPIAPTMPNEQDYAKQKYWL